MERAGAVRWLVGLVGAGGLALGALELGFVLVYAGFISRPVFVVWSGLWSAAVGVLGGYVWVRSWL